MSTAYSYIRWSSAKQADGTSLERQTAAAVEYAKRHKLTLSKDTYLDASMSAKSGKNVELGALRVFLNAVDAGHIPSNSFLLVENFDRLSRLPPRRALKVLQEIVDRGITLVTLTDGKQYSTTSLDENWTDFIMALAVMARAHEENKRKGDNVRAAWEKNAANGEVLTSNGPKWLKLDKNDVWQHVPKKVKIVQQVFELAYAGHGAPTIARLLANAKTDTLGEGKQKAEFWTAGLVSGLLKNEAVIGTLTRKKAKSAPIPGYYGEPIIDPKVFDAVQAQIKGRRRTGGPQGATISNLFTGLLKCECGRRAKFVSGAKPHL